MSTFISRPSLTYSTPQAVYLSIYGLHHAGAREFLRLPFLPLKLPAAVESALPPVFGDLFNGKGIPLLVFFILAYLSDLGGMTALHP